MTNSPSTVPIRTSEFVIADRLALSRFEGDEIAAVGRLYMPLWRLQRKEPGWVVGEHMQVLRRLGADISERITGSPLVMADIERPGEVGRSIEKRMEAAGGEDPTKFTRVGEDDRERKLEVDRAEKVDEDAAKTLTEGAAGDENAEESKRPPGHIACFKPYFLGNTGPLDLDLDGADILVNKYDKR